MKKFRVIISRWWNVEESFEIEVEAADESEAKGKAREAAMETDDKYWVQDKKECIDYCVDSCEEGS